jgi:hypothetical protein
MDAKDYISVAHDLCRTGAEAHWRTAANRAYYAAMLVIRDAFQRWGLSPPSQSLVHQLVRQRLFTSRDADVKTIGRLLDELRHLRRLADYDTASLPVFLTDAEAINAVRRARTALTLFDAIDTDLPRRNAVLVEIQRVFP